MSDSWNGVPMHSMITACAPITAPTAITIFQWLSLSSGREPILENRSEPLQNRMAIRENTNQDIKRFLSYSYLDCQMQKGTQGGGLRGNLVLCQHCVRLNECAFTDSRLLFEKIAALVRRYLHSGCRRTLL